METDLSDTCTICEGPELDAQRSQRITPATCQYDTIHRHKQRLQVKIYLDYDMCLHCSTQEEDILEHGKDTTPFVVIRVT